MQCHTFLSVTYTPGLQVVHIYLHSLHVPAESRKTESAAEAVLDMQDKQPQLVRLAKTNVAKMHSRVKNKLKNYSRIFPFTLWCFCKDTVKYFVT